jgi:hypothetical protein
MAQPIIRHNIEKKYFNIKKNAHDAVEIRSSANCYIKVGYLYQLINTQRGYFESIVWRVTQVDETHYSNITEAIAILAGYKCLAEFKARVGQRPADYMYTVIHLTKN